MSSKELLIHSAVTLIATGKADQAAEALTMATQLISELERALDARDARRSRAMAAAKATPKKSSTSSRTTKAKPAASASGRTAAVAKVKQKPLPIRARRVLERIGVVRPDADPTPRELRSKVCEAHLFSAKNCGNATIQQVATWFQEHGETLPAECATYSDDWLTSRCDEKR